MDKSAPTLIWLKTVTVFPRIEARASISFQQVFTPASKQDRPLIEAGVYFLMFVEAFVDFQFFVQNTMAASRRSRVALRSVYERKRSKRAPYLQSILDA